MARTRPYFRPQIDDSIREKLEEKRHQDRFHGSMAAYVEGILEKFAEGILVEAPAAASDVRAVRVKQAGKDEHRKTG